MTRPTFTASDTGCHADGALAAYTERETHLGSLRTEYRLTQFKESDPDQQAALIAAWGPDWRRFKPFCAVVVESRYIRRGTPEPWLPFSNATTEELALSDLGDSGLQAVDPRLLRIQQDRERTAQEAELQRESDAKAAAQAQKYRDKRRASRAAFERLRNSATGRQWAVRWNEFVSAHLADANYKAKVGSDPAFMAKYQAVMGATTVPAKRKAIRLFLEAYA